MDGWVLKSHRYVKEKPGLETAKQVASFIVMSKIQPHHKTMNSEMKVSRATAVIRISVVKSASSKFWMRWYSTHYAKETYYFHS